MFIIIIIIIVRPVRLVLPVPSFLKFFGDNISLKDVPTGSLLWQYFDKQENLPAYGKLATIKEDEPSSLLEAVVKI